MPEGFTYDDLLYYLLWSIEYSEEFVTYDDRELLKPENVLEVTTPMYIYKDLYKYACDHPGDPDYICQTYFQQQQQFYELANGSEKRYVFQQAMYEIQLLYEDIWTNWS